MTTTFKKALTALGMGAFAIVPAFAFAHDGDKASSVANKTAVSIAISDNGSTLVRGARVTDVDADGDITATTVVNGVTMTWTVDTDGDTDFVDVDGDGIAADDINDGDYVSFSGTLTGSGVVDASTVRDWSIGEDNDDPGNGKKHGFWNRFKNWPGVHFFFNAKADVR